MDGNCQTITRNGFSLLLVHDRLVLRRSDGSLLRRYDAAETAGIFSFLRTALADDLLNQDLVSENRLAFVKLLRTTSVIDIPTGSKLKPSRLLDITLDGGSESVQLALSQTDFSRLDSSYRSSTKPGKKAGQQ